VSDQGESSGWVSLPRPVLRVISGGFVLLAATGLFLAAFGGGFHSAHHFSSFNNPAYRASVRETRRLSLGRDGAPRAARRCAGCHDPVPPSSGEFDDPNSDDVKATTSQAGITCTVCRAIKHVNSTRGHADDTIAEPGVYPFAASTSPRGAPSRRWSFP
jgi:hypothetical protein